MGAFWVCLSEITSFVDRFWAQTRQNGLRCHILFPDQAWGPPYWSPVCVCLREGQCTKTLSRDEILSLSPTPPDGVNACKIPVLMSSWSYASNTPITSTSFTRGILKVTLAVVVLKKNLWNREFVIWNDFGHLRVKPPARRPVTSIFWMSFISVKRDQSCYSKILLFCNRFLAFTKAVLEAQK